MRKAQNVLRDLRRARRRDDTDGIRRAFPRFGKWVRTTVAPAMEKPRNEIAQLLPGFAEMFDTYDG